SAELVDIRACYLAGGRPGDAGHGPVSGRAARFTEYPRGVELEVFRGNGLVQHHEDLNLLPPPFTGCAHCQAFPNRGVLCQGCLHLVWRDKDAATLDHQTRAPDDPVAAMIITNDLIASPEPAVDHSSPGCLWVVPVAGEQKFAG